MVLYTAPERVSSRLSSPNEKMVHRPLTEIPLGSSSECLPKDEAMHMIMMMIKLRMMMMMLV